MSKRIFTKNQIEDLLLNKNVERCSEKSITYSKEFKIRAIKQYNEEGLSSTMIFKQAGFDLNIIGKDTPDGLMYTWRKILKEKGLKELSKETRGRGRIGKGPQNIKGSDKEKMEFLELKIAYLEEENRFLKILRKQKGLD